MAIDGLRRMVENRGAETWDTFMDDNIITPFENKINQLEQNGGIDQETKDKIDNLINNGVSSNLYNPSDDNVTIFVNQVDGNDITGDGSEEKPYATLEKAWNRIPYLVNTSYTIKIVGNYSINNTFKFTGKHIIHGKGEITLTSGDKENRSNITSNYAIYVNGIRSYMSALSESTFTSNFTIKDINISATINFNNSNFLIKNVDNIKSDSKNVNIIIVNCIGGLYNTIISNGVSNINLYNNSSLYVAGSSITNPSGVNFSLVCFSKLMISKNCELANSGSPAKFDNGCVVINNIEEA